MQCKITAITSKELLLLSHTSGLSLLPVASAESLPSDNHLQLESQNTLVPIKYEGTNLKSRLI
jgi:hypothetical protein